MSENNRRPRAIKLYVVTDSNEQKVYVKAKTKSSALDYIVGKHFKVDVVNAKDMVSLADAIASGVEIHEVH
jgi:hypothetical protein